MSNENETHLSKTILVWWNVSESVGTPSVAITRSTSLGPIWYAIEPSSNRWWLVGYLADPFLDDYCTPISRVEDSERVGELNALALAQFLECLPGV